MQVFVLSLSLARFLDDLSYRLLSLGLFAPLGCDSRICLDFSGQRRIAPTASRLEDVACHAFRWDKISTTAICLSRGGLSWGRLHLIVMIVIRASSRRGVLCQSHVVSRIASRRILIHFCAAVVVAFRETHTIQSLLNGYDSVAGFATMKIFGALLG